MIHVVIDTNVLVAALLAPRGSNMHALRRLISHPDAFTVFYSSQMMDEYEDVLLRPVISSRGLSPEARALLRLLVAISEQVVPSAIGYVVYPDRKDKPFLEAAVHVGGVLITNNLKDFPFLGVVVLAPEEFLGWCDERGLV